MGCLKVEGNHILNPIFDAVSGLATAILSPITTIVNGWQSRSTAKLNSDLAIAQAITTAKINYAATAQAGEQAWDQEAITVSGWKSGYLTILLSIPLALCFIPQLAPFVKDGFTSLESAPEWYRYAIGVMIGADFGMRKATDVIGALKK